MCQQNILNCKPPKLKLPVFSIETDYLVAGLARLQVLVDSFHRERIQPEICVLDSGCFQDLRCLRCCFDAKPLPTLLHLEAILGQETWNYTLVNQHGNRKCTRIEDVFPLKNGGFSIAMLVHQSHQRVRREPPEVRASFSNLVGIHVQTFQDIVAPQGFSHCQSPSFSHQVS